jgi:hypothetical protein
MGKVKKEGLSDIGLTGEEKKQVLICESLSPILAGAIFYYGWKKSMPKKASQANKWSYLMILVFFIIAGVLQSLSL